MVLIEDMADVYHLYHLVVFFVLFQEQNCKYGNPDEHGKLYLCEQNISLTVVPRLPDFVTF